MIPEAIAFSDIAGVEPWVDLFGAFMLSVTVAGILFSSKVAKVIEVSSEQRICRVRGQLFFVRSV